MARKLPFFTYLRRTRPSSSLVMIFVQSFLVSKSLKVFSKTYIKMLYSCQLSAVISSRDGRVCSCFHCVCMMMMMMMGLSSFFLLQSTWRTIQLCSHDFNHGRFTASNQAYNGREMWRISDHINFLLCFLDLHHLRRSNKHNPPTWVTHLTATRDHCSRCQSLKYYWQQQTNNNKNCSSLMILQGKLQQQSNWIYI